MYFQNKFLNKLTCYIRLSKGQTQT